MVLIFGCFDFQGNLESQFCESCGYHVRLFNSEEAEGDGNRKTEICDEKCKWIQAVRALPHLDDEESKEAGSRSLWQLIKNRLHHQCLVELKAKALPGNLQLPIKSLNQLSTFLKSRISLTPDPRIATPPIDKSALIITAEEVKQPKKRGRPRKSLDPNQPQPAQSTPVQPDRVSRETSRLLALDSSFLEIIMTHPEGYSPRSILYTPERSLNRSSTNRSVTFSANNTYIEPSQFDDDDSDNDSTSSEDSRECSRSPGSPVPTKKRRIADEAHPIKLASPNKLPPSSPPPPPPVMSSNSTPKTSKPAKSPKPPKEPSKKKSTEQSKSNNGSPKDGGSSKAKKDKKDPKSANKKPIRFSPTSKRNSPEIKFKLAALLHGLGKGAVKKKQHQQHPSHPHTFNKRLQGDYLKRKFGARFLRCQVLVERKNDVALRLLQTRTAFAENLAESRAMDEEVAMICQSDDEKIPARDEQQSPEQPSPAINSNTQRISINGPSSPFSTLKSVEAAKQSPPPLTNGTCSTAIQTSSPSSISRRRSLATPNGSASSSAIVDVVETTEITNNGQAIRS